MTPDDIRSIQHWRTSQDATVTLKLQATADGRSREFKTFAEEFTRVAGTIDFVHEYESDNGPPAIRLGDVVTYRAVPAGGELEPFLLALTPETGKIQPNDIPADLKLFVAPQCREQFDHEVGWSLQVFHIDVQGTERRPRFVEQAKHGPRFAKSSGRDQ